MKKISNLLFKNITWKCLSVILAILLWLICVNVVNPLETKSFTNRLVIDNLDIVESNGYVLLNKDELENMAIRMSVKAVSNSFTSIMNSHFQPYIDVSPIDYLREENLGMDQPLNVYVELLGPAALSSFNPASIETNPLKVNIRLDRITEVIKPVTVNTTGIVMESYVALPGQTSPENIKITGPSTILNRISTVGVEVDVSGASDDIIINLTPRIIDIDKKDITDQVSIDVEYVEAKVPINMYAKIPVRQNYVGNVAEGYDITSITKSIEYAEVVGAAEDIASISHIQLPDLNVSGWSATETRSFDVRQALMGTQLSVVNGTPHEVLITVNIEKQLKKEITLNIEDIRVIGMSGNEVSLPGGQITVIVKGLPEKINSLDETMLLDASINVSGLEPGLHEVGVSILLPQGIYLDGSDPLIEVAISEVTAEMPNGEEPGGNDIEDE